MPNTAITFSRFVTVISVITRMRLTFDTQSSPGFMVAATPAYRAFTTSPTPRGRSMSSTSDRAILVTSTDTPSSSIGSTTGM